MPERNIEDYEIVVLGTGEGAKYLAWTLAKAGKRVVAIERKYVGGSCPNIACLPSKNVIHSAKVASYVRGSEAFGDPARNSCKVEDAEQNKHDADGQFHGESEPGWNDHIEQNDAGPHGENCERVTQTP